MPLILEGIVTTENEDGSVNVSPMGPIVTPAMDSLLLRPYNTSTTYKNLKRIRRGVFHVTDDVDMLSRAAVGLLSPAPPMKRHVSKQCWILEEACRWYTFEVQSIDDESQRTSIQCEVTDRGRLRDFFGFNRAKHAVIEAAIIATRIDFLPPEQVSSELERLSVIVDKTAGEQEMCAFEFLREFINRETAISTN